MCSVQGKALQVEHHRQMRDSNRKLHVNHTLPKRAEKDMQKWIQSLVPRLSCPRSIA